MPKKQADRPSYRCGECGWQTSKWVGRCGECQAWGTVAEHRVAPSARKVTAGPVSMTATPIMDVPTVDARHRPTSVPELDRVLGGGLVEGAAVLLAGEPGVGKSTLLLEVAAAAARAGTTALYVTGEESAAQVRLRADRVNALADGLYLAAETDLGAVLGQVEAVQPGLVIVDSVQTVAAADTEGVAGGAAQVRTVAATLVRAAKERGIPTVLVGHVTKDGTVAGPKVMEHLVDVVLSFEGDRHTRLRMVRAVKNRFGSTDEVGCFDLGHEGITSLPDPSGLFLSRLAKPVAGTCVTVTLEGRRPLVAELQALVTAGGPQGTPRRTTSGLDPSRLALIIAVLQRRARLPVGVGDVFAATVGGVRLGEPAADLALALALASASTDRPVDAGTVAIGEVGLAGEVRRVPDVRQRLAEAARLGFQRALVPPDSGAAPDGIEVVEVGDIESALLAVGVPAGTSRSTAAAACASPATARRQGRRGNEEQPSRPVHLRPISP
ncbi:MAG: DNA repair protein RadA [Streptosporangiales bacterium]|nr:DNA repair protein RadA [Streptosporangiales bacterium]